MIPFISGLIAGALALSGAWFGLQDQSESTLGAFGDPFKSIRLATDPDNGECLTTDGADNVWSSDCGDGGVGGSGDPFPFTPQTWGNSTSTVIGFTQGIISNASSTFTSTLRLSNFTSGSLAVDAEGDIYKAATTTFSTGLTYSNGAVTADLGTAIDISGETNLTAGDALTLTDDDLDFDGGASPGGELGNTWASPTIDDSLAVSSWNLTTPTFTTNFTFDGVTVTGLSGIDTSVITGTAGTSGNCAEWDANGDLVDAGDPCGTGAGGGGSGTFSTTTSTVAGQLINYPNNDDDIVAIGANATTSAEFYFDPNTLQAVFGTGAAGDSSLAFGPNTSNQWIMGYDETDKSFAIASSTALGSSNVLTIGKTFGIRNANNHTLGQATTFRVATTTADGDYTSLITAFAALPSTGGSIEIGCGTFALGSGLLFDKSNVVIKGQGRCTNLTFDGETVPTAVRMADSTQRFNIVMEDLLISNVGAAGNGVCIDFTDFTLSHFVRVDCGSTNIGYQASTTDTHYNTIESPRISVSGTGSHFVYLSSGTQNAPIGNTLINVRGVGDASTTGYYINAHQTTCIKCFSETSPAIGMLIGVFANDSTLDVYLEANTVNLQFEGNPQGTAITGFIADADTTNVVGLEYADGVDFRARVQYLPVRAYLIGQGATKYGMGIGTTSDDHPLTIAATSSSAAYNQLRIDNSNPTATSPTGIVFSNQAGFVDTARISASPGTSFTNTSFRIAVANSSKALVDRLTIDVNGLVTIENATTTRFSSTYASSTDQVIGRDLTFGGVTGNSWDDFCATITGSSALCDGDDASGAGGGEFPFTVTSHAGTTTSATSTPLFLRGNAISLLASSTAYFDTLQSGVTIIGAPGDANNPGITVGGAAGGPGLYYVGTNTLGLSNGLLDEVQLGAGDFSPVENDDVALGTASLTWSDLFLASGAVININSDILLTHSADLLALSGGTFRTNDLQLTTGSGLRTGTSAGNTVLFQARDVDGAAYTTFATLTANDTPTFSILPTTVVVDPTGSIAIPQSATVTVDAAGELALDTTTNNLILATSTNAGGFVVASATTTLYSFSVASTSPDLRSGGIIDLPAHFLPQNAVAIMCHVDGGTSVVVNLSDGTNDTQTVTCSTTRAQYVVSTNAQFTANEAIRLEVGTVTGAVDYVVIRVLGYRVSD